jgi:hypothetical protein
MCIGDEPSSRKLKREHKGHSTCPNFGELDDSLVTALFKKSFKIPQKVLDKDLDHYVGDDMGTVIPLAFDGRRRRPRRRIRQIAIILAEPGSAVSYCLVTDTSDDGVQIRTRSDFEVPKEFVMRLRNTDRRYTVVWREGPVLGAKLVS